MRTSRSRRDLALAQFVATVAIVATGPDAARAEAEGPVLRREPGVQREPGPDGWYDATPPDGSFRVRVPVDFEAFGEQGANEQGAIVRTSGIRATAAGAFDGQIHYAANCALHEGERRSARERLLESTERWEKRSMLRYKRALEIAGSPGVEFEMADDVKVIRTRVVAPDRRTCTLVMTWRPFARPGDAEIAKFFDSFELR